MEILTNAGSHWAVRLLPVTLILALLIEVLDTSLSPATKEVLLTVVSCGVGMLLGWLAGELARSHAPAISQVLLGLASILGAVVVVHQAWKKVQAEFGNVDVGRFLRVLFGLTPDHSTSQELHWGLLGFLIMMFAGWLYEKTKPAAGA